MSNPKTPWEKVKEIQYQMVYTAGIASTAVFLLSFLGVGGGLVTGVSSLVQTLALCYFSTRLQNVRLARYKD